MMFKCLILFQKHNKYVAAKVNFADTEEAESFKKYLIQRLNDMAAEDQAERSRFTFW